MDEERQPTLTAKAAPSTECHSAPGMFLKGARQRVASTASDLEYSQAYEEAKVLHITIYP